MTRVPRVVAHRDGGQILVLFALFMVVLLVLVGSGYDYASIVVDEARLQNAVDAAALAGSDSLSRYGALPAGTPVAIAEATAVEFLRLNGVATSTPGTNVSVVFPTSTPAAGATPSPLRENMTLSVARYHPTAFWPLIGINGVSMQGSGSARAARGMTDVMLSLDTTGSEVIAGSFGAIQQAVVDFVNQMNPTPTDPRGPRIGIARFAGIRCTWYDDDADGRMDVSSTAAPVSEYRTPCTDDRALLSGLTNVKTTLLKIADNSGAGTCPVGVLANGGCPLAHVQYSVPGATSLRLNYGGSPITIPLPGGPPYYSGTKLPNAFAVVKNAGYDAWSTANGGRNDSPVGSGWARKVMIMMTDGQNEAWPSGYSSPDYAFPESVSSYDSQMQTQAAALKLGPDGTVGTPDDVEVYVIGYFCTPYSTELTDTPEKFCKSRIAGTALPHPCPGPVYPPVGYSVSTIDTLLNTLASSTPGSCDHYFPLSKSESLPQLFQTLAGKISRGQLTN